MITNVLDYFSASVERFPEKDAVVCGEEKISFSELDKVSNQIASAIKELAPNAGPFIPFIVPKSIEAISSILSILKVDSAYIPIDSNSPATRMASIMEASSARVVLVVDETEVIAHEAIQDTDIQVLNLNKLQLENYPSDRRPYQSISTDLAYVLFTSGSTGVPKGVMIPHRAIVDYIDWCVEEYEITESDVVSNHAPLYFDNSTFDLYTAFKAGATLHLVPEQLNAVLPRLVKWLKNSDITVFFCVPSVLTMLLKSRRLKADSFPKLRRILAAGEALPPHVLREWMLLYPSIQFTNMYGPTEITVDCSFHTLTDVPAPDCVSIPIGKPRPNMAMYVLTEAGELTQKPGAKGELLVRGTSVSYGYLNDSEKTEAAFIQNPNHNLYPDSLYKTGDVVSIDEQLNFHFVGRADNQVKYLGYRIELGEIESKMLTLDEIDECVVCFGKNRETGDDFIGAFIKANRLIEDASLQQKVANLVPGYMVPSVIVRSEQDFPSTPNGKYDRKSILKRLEAER